MSRLVSEWLRKFGSLDPQLPHGSNLVTKLKEYDRLDSDKQKALDAICKEYEAFQSVCSRRAPDSKKWLRDALRTTEKYLAALNRPELDVFSHQSDFKSSVIPEFFYFLFRDVVNRVKPSLVVESQKQIVIELDFVPESYPIAPKLKRVDVAILKKTKLKVDKTTVEDFAMPVVAVENKTNLDKNMVSAVEHSVESLKKTFPLCKYYLVSEFADFAVESQNYAATFIDEILILRSQKRSKVRRGARVSPVSRKLLAGFMRDIETHLTRATRTPKSVKEAMRVGRLIGKRE